MSLAGSIDRAAVRTKNFSQHYIVGGSVLANTPRTPVAGDRDRRWIADEYFDLIVWYEDDQTIHGFQLCYDKPGRERALTWTRAGGFQHTAIDSGESRPTANRTPILIPDGAFPARDVRREFLARGTSLPPELRELVLARIAEYEGPTATT
jgi:hypothetical protein